MAYAVDTYTGDGSKVDFDLTFPYIQRDHVKVVRIDGDTETALTVTSGAPSGGQYSWEDNDTIKVGTAPTSSQQLKIYRDTPENAQIVQWQDGSYIVAVDLNTSDKQWLYLIQENTDLIKAIEDLIPTVDREAITEPEAVADPTNPAWSGDERLATVGAINRLFSQIVGTGGGFPGDGNLGLNGKLRIDNVTNGTPDLFFWDATADSPAWVQVNTKGDQGPQGPVGPAPGLQDPAAVATTVPNKGDGSVGDATAAVEQDANKDLKFTFGIPQGVPGPQGPPGDGVDYQGPIDAVTTPAPDNPGNGDFYVNTEAGTADPSWTGLTDLTENDRLIFNAGTGEWDRYRAIESQTNLAYEAATDRGTITNDNGDDAVILTASSDHAGLMVPAQNDKLAGIAEGAEANVQSDWNETDTNSDAFIQNKPDVIQSDWNQTNTSQVDFIRNKPTIPAAQVQSDWAETDANAVSFIQNKPFVADAPSDGEQYARQDGAWTVVEAGGGATVSVGDNPPTDPAPVQGDLWWNSDDGRMYVFFVDATSSQWVDASPDSGAMTPGINPPDNPNNGDLWVDLGECPPVLNIWSDCSGTGEWNPVQGGLVAPVIQQVNLGEGQGGAGRFTGATFPVEGVMAEEGNPVSQRFLRAVLTEGVQQLRANPQLRAITRPVTSEITLVEDVQFADDIVMHSSSENSWAHIGWAGPPFNRYIAYATGGSNNFYWAWSTDGETWNQFKGPKGASTAYGVNWCYRDANQAIYVGSAGQNTVYNTISTLDQLLDYENNGEGWVTSRPHDNASWRSGMQYDPVNDRICAYRGPWDVSNTFMTKSPFPAALDDSGWYVTGGQGGATISQGTMLTNSLGNSYYVGPMAPHNEATYNMAYALDANNTGSSPSIRQGLYTRDTNSYTGRCAYCPTTNRWFVNGWYWTGDDPTNFPSSVSSWTGWTQNVPKLDGASFTHLFFSNQLNQLILLGSVKNTGDTIFQYCHWRSADGGDTWTDPILTNPAEGTYGYWSYGLEATNLATHLLCSSAGNVAGRRFGSSQTLGSTETLPQLTFANDTGLDTFSVGNVVTQDDDAATGNVARIGPGARMIINATTGTWGPANQGRFLIGPARNYDPAWADFDQNGNITRLLPFDPGWQLMNGDGPWNLTFPATFEDGTVPDDVIPAATSLRVDLLAASESGGFIASDDDSSNEVTPT